MEEIGKRKKPKSIDFSFLLTYNYFIEYASWRYHNIAS